MRVLPNNIDEIAEFLDTTDIANQAKVSRVTVYKVLKGDSNNQRVIEVIWEKVEAMAKLVQEAKSFTAEE